MIGENTMELMAAAVHRVGNRSEEEGVFNSSGLLCLDDTLKEVLTTYFTSAFKTEEFFNFYNKEGLDYNFVYTAAATIFHNPETLYDQSLMLANFLYEKSNKPNIKSGELYVTYFQGDINGEATDVIGLFKSESKETFLQVRPEMSGLELSCQEGVSLRKLDKGCLIFNRSKEEGYVLSVTDNSNRSEALYWMDEFLEVRQRRDSYANTQDVMAMCKEYVVKELPQQFEVSKADQVDLLNKSVDFFKQNDHFTMDDFTDQVIAQPELIDSFNKYRTGYQKERDIEIADEFAISDSAVKKGSRSIRSVIKLDKNFHIYVHGNRNLLEQGEDEKGKYYKVYYKEES